MENQKRFDMLSNLRKRLSAAELRLSDLFENEDDKITQAWTALLKQVDAERQRLRKLPGVK